VDRLQLYFNWGIRHIEDIMRIIKPGHIEKAVVTCRKCKCVFELTKNEAKVYHTDYSNCDRGYGTIKCPNSECKETVFVGLAEFN
jgi:hypothetical protein